MDEPLIWARITAGGDRYSVGSDTTDGIRALVHNSYVTLHIDLRLDEGHFSIRDRKGGLIYQAAIKRGDL